MTDEAHLLTLPEGATLTIQSGASQSNSSVPGLGDPPVPFNRQSPAFRVQSHASIPQPAGMPADSTRQAPNGEAFDHRFIASTELLASDGGIILLSAWRLDGFMKRPRFIAMHDIFGWDNHLGEIALGRVVDIRIEEGLSTEQVGPSGKALVAYVRYASTDIAKEVRLLYEEGGLDDVSVRWDFRTEEIRQPFEEEVQAFGDNLFWVATRVDLMEISSVIFGADPGAQMIRSDLERAFDRCRKEGHNLPLLDKMLTQGLPVQVPVARHAKRDLDEAAVADALDQLSNAMTTLDVWAQAFGPIRESIGDAVTGIANLLETSTDVPEGEELDEERSKMMREVLQSMMESMEAASTFMEEYRSADPPAADPPAPAADPPAADPPVAADPPAADPPAPAADPPAADPPVAADPPAADPPAPAADPPAPAADPPAADPPVATDEPFMDVSAVLADMGVEEAK